MQIFNTLTRQKEEFVPQVPGEYRIYVCGPTVYNYIHIGNARPLIVFDTLRRYLEYRGNKVIYVSNITDIDDKLIKKGQEEGTSMKEVAQRFEAEYLKDAEGLNCKKPTVQPRATEHIQQILDIVKDLIDPSLQERRIYRKNRTHSLRSKPGCKSNSMCLCNSNIKKSIWKFFLKFCKSCSILHRCCYCNYFVIFFC